MKRRLAKIFSAFIHFYGHVIPYHRGKWRVFDFLINYLKLNVYENRRVIRRGIKWELDLISFIDCRLYYMGVHEVWDTRFVECVIKPGFVFFDVGANIGYYTLLAAKLAGPSGEVHSFEPSPESFAKLSLNLHLNGFNIVHLNQVPLSDVTGKVYLTEARDLDTIQITNKSDTNLQEVESITLDLYVERINISRLDMIKVDIEGAEHKFLLGGIRTLKRFRPIIIIELNPAVCEDFGTSVEDIVVFLKGLDYALYEAKPHGLRRLEKLPFGSEVFFNAIALPADLWTLDNIMPWRSLKYVDRRTRKRKWN